MSIMGFLTIWLLGGIVSFFLARASWQLQFGCAPVTIGTIFFMLFSMWVPPMSLLLGITFYFCWLFDGIYGEGNSFGVPIKSFLRKPLFNPCKWSFRKKDTRTKANPW